MALEALKLAQAVSSITSTGSSSASADPAGGSGFADKLTSLIDNVEKTSSDANVAVDNMLNKTGDVHDAMIALQRAEMTLQMTVQLRNKFVQAYHDIMRMPI